MKFTGISSALAVSHRSPVSDVGRRASDRRRWLIPMAVLTLAASLLLVPAVPAIAVDGVPDHPAQFSACVGPALEPAGFRDMDGSFAEDAANCLAHYEITKGTGQGVFSPGRVVPRKQMALFLVRAAHPAGITVPEASDQGFTDLNVGSETRNAINQLAALGIMTGTSSTTFDPQAPVTRREMAVLLARFLSVAPRGPGGTNIDMISPGDDHFVDLSGVPFRTRTDIRKLYELGVTDGTTAITFSPFEEVNRAQMAVFISRMLAHTNARPAGLNAQVAAAEDLEDSDIRVLISYRNSHRQPLADRQLDIFMSTDPDKAFDESGNCTGNVAPAVGTRSCVVESSDRMTGSSGNLFVDLEVGDVYTLRLWAWRGGNGDVYDDDSDRALVIDVKTPASATAWEVSDDMQPTARKLRFDAAVTFTFQLVDDDGDPVRKPGVEFTIDARQTRNGRSTGPTTISKETGPDGSAEVPFRHADLSEDEPGDIARLDLDIRDSSGLEVSDRTTIGMVTNDSNNEDVFLEWADEEDETTTLRLSVASEYRVASSQGSGANSTVRAHLTDQYGSGVGRETIAFTSSDSSVVPTGVNRTTNAGGVATLNYRRDSDLGGTERITGGFGNLVATARQYWAATIPAGTDGSGEVTVVDTENNAAVVVSDGDVWIVEYDVADRFKIGKKAVLIAGFEKVLSVGDTLAYEIAASATGVNTFTLTSG